MGDHPNEKSKLCKIGIIMLTVVNISIQISSKENVPKIQGFELFV